MIAKITMKKRRYSTRTNVKKRKKDGKKEKSMKYSKSLMKIKLGNISTEAEKKNKDHKKDQDRKMKGFYAILWIY